MTTCKIPTEGLGPEQIPNKQQKLTYIHTLPRGLPPSQDGAWSLTTEPHFMTPHISST